MPFRKISFFFVNWECEGGYEMKNDGQKRSDFLDEKIDEITLMEPYSICTSLQSF